MSLFPIKIKYKCAHLLIFQTRENLVCTLKPFFYFNLGIKN